MREKIYFACRLLIKLYWWVTPDSWKFLKDTYENAQKTEQNLFLNCKSIIVKKVVKVKYSVIFWMRQKLT